jgi:hypothetical protein
MKPFSSHIYFILFPDVSGTVSHRLLLPQNKKLELAEQPRVSRQNGLLPSAKKSAHVSFSKSIDFSLTKFIKDIYIESIIIFSNKLDIKVYRMINLTIFWISYILFFFMILSNFKFYFCKTRRAFLFSDKGSSSLAGVQLEA